MSDSNANDITKEIRNSFNPEYFKHYLGQIHKYYIDNKLDWEEQNKLRNEVIERAADHYTKARGLDPKTARAAIMDIAGPEPGKPLDVQQTLEKLLWAIRTLSPQVSGVVQREKDVDLALTEINKQLRHLDFLGEEIKRIKSDINLQRLAFNKSIELLEENTNITLTQVIKSYYKRFLNLIKLK